MQEFLCFAGHVAAPMARKDFTERRAVLHQIRPALWTSAWGSAQYSGSEYQGR